MREPTDAEKAWMAGFMDDEGTITISKQIRKGRPSPAFRPKGKQADLVVSFISTKNAFAREKRTCKGSAPLAQAEIAHRQGLCTAIRLLNSKSKTARSALAVV